MKMTLMRSMMDSLEPLVDKENLLGTIHVYTHVHVQHSHRLLDVHLQPLNFSHFSI